MKRSNWFKALALRLVHPIPPKNKEKSISLKTIEDSQNSVNAQEPKIPYPWLVFNDKDKVNSVFLRDSTAVSDSVLLLFGGKISRGGLDGHLKMLGGYLEFFMKPSLADTYLRLKNELEELIQMKKAVDHMAMLLKKSKKKRQVDATKWRRYLFQLEDELGPELLPRQDRFDPITDSNTIRNDLIRHMVYGKEESMFHLKRISSWSFDEKLFLQSLFKVLVSVSETSSIILYIRDVERLLQSQRLYKLFDRMLKKLSGSVVILGSRMLDPDEDCEEVDDRIAEVLAANDLECDDLGSICNADAMVLGNYIEEIVVSAISDHLMNNNDPMYRNGKLVISSKSLSHGLSIFQEGRTGRKDSLKLETNAESSK
ncbi:DExH-box ATP-dependent RNA helicase DExH3, partial [Camellia lanceoleosa]